MSKKYILNKFPMSPSSNQLYASVRGRLIKSAAGKAYEGMVVVYGLRNRRVIDNIMSDLKEDCELRVDCRFVFPKHRLYNKKGKLKKLDWSNRLKSLHDELSKLIKTDDSQFICGFCEKVINDIDESEYVIVEISKL